MLSPQLLQLLRAWWPEGRRRNLLLPGGHVATSCALTIPSSASAGCIAVIAASTAFNC